MEGVVNGHSLDQRGVEEMTKLGHQVAPLVPLGVVAEEAVQRGVEGVCDLQLGTQGVDEAATCAGLGVVEGGGQRADRCPGVAQRVVVLHLDTVTPQRIYTCPLNAWLAVRTVTHSVYGLM